MKLVEGYDEMMKDIKKGVYDTTPYLNEYVPPTSANSSIEQRCQERRATGNFKKASYHINSTCSSVFTYATEEWKAYDLPEVQAAEIEHLKTINEELLIQSVEWAKVVEKNQELQEWARQACMELRQAETANDLIRAALRELIDEKMSNLQLFLPKPDTSLIK